jgi:ubiquinone/menaquinone biosynthesis C-methylase UbiE
LTEYLQKNFNWRLPECTSAYDDWSAWSAPFALLLLKHLPLRPHCRYLDLACGTGVPLVQAVERLGPTCQAVGLDLGWWNGLRRAQQKLRAWQIPNAALACGDGARLPFGAETFDLIVSCLGINNFSDPAQAFRECRRVLRPGGRLALATNLSGHMREFYEVFAATLTELGRDDLQAGLAAHIEHRGSEESLRRQLEAAGFRVRRAVHEPFTMRYLDGSALLRHSNILLGFLPNWRSLVPPELEAAFFERLEANLNQSAARAGELSLTIPACYIEAERAGNGF